ncbi:hypothetical protein P8452_13744 [Trifolium repens]|nr:hypothetical protein P8452_13744 [Trifolium repens]
MQTKRRSGTNGIVLISHETIEVNEKREDERRESSASDLKNFLWHNGSVYDAWFYASFVDVLLCGVYARREANYGNIDLARKVFDMALLSVEGTPEVIIVITLAQEDVDFSLWRKISLFFSYI